MENLNLTDLKLWQEDLRDIIKLLEILRSINVNQAMNYCKL